MVQVEEGRRSLPAVGGTGIWKSEYIYHVTIINGLDLSGCYALFALCVCVELHVVIRV
jgi:hypothetical protein